MARSLIIFIVGLLIGCGKNFNNSDIDPWAVPTVVRAELAQELSADEARKVQFDHSLLERLQIEGNERFVHFFGGPHSRDVAQYVASGVKFVAPGSRSDTNPIVQNYGFALYIEGMAKGSFEPLEWSGGKWMTPATPDNGLILLHHYETQGNAVRAGDWPHERRHGDCPGAPNHADATRLRDFLEGKTTSLPTDLRTCGHLHSICPDWHSLKGKAGCDSTRDGAYSYGLEWARAVRDSCKNCDPSFKDAAAAMVIEYESRIVAP